jgi:hypothetical protein
MNMRTFWEAVCSTVPMIIKHAPQIMVDLRPRMSAIYGANGSAQRDPMFCEIPVVINELQDA